MNISNLENATKVQSGLDAYKMYTSANLEIVHLHLSPGDQIALHSNPVDVIFSVIDGTAILEVEGTTHELNKFDVVEIKAGVQRGLSNRSIDDFRVLVIKKLV